MKKTLFFITFSFLLLVFCPKVKAHNVGQPPFFKVDGEYSNLYPVQSTSLENFELPQDLSPRNYLVGESIDFEIDTKPLQVPEEIVKQTNFTWDFGDGGKGTGLKNTYSYKKQGSYILKVYTQTRQDTEPQLLETVLLNIIPSKDYKLPKPVLKINDWITKDPVNDVAKTKFGQILGFDGSLSTDSSKITEYIWDFGDGKTATGAKVTHSIDPQFNLVFPLLRIKDEAGFFADAYVQIDNADSGQANSLAHPIGSYKEATVSKDKLKLLIPSAFILLIFIIIVIASKRKQGKK